MQARATGARTLMLSSIITLSVTFTGCPAMAGTSSHHSRSRSHHTSSAHHHTTHGRRAVAQGISCVPYARNESGIDVPGNARDWWDNAAGTYARGDVPQAGSVLAFRANPRMRLGHVAVVSHVINPREIEVDQANWRPGGRISHNVMVVDVSEENDWTAVRVELNHRGDFGAVYPTYGFIYNRTDTGTMLASAAPPVPALTLDPAPRDLRAPAERDNEVAEAPGPAPAPPHGHARLHHVLHVSGSVHHTTRHHATPHKG